MPLVPGMWCSARTVRVVASMTNKRSGLAPVIIRSPAAARGTAPKEAASAAQPAQTQQLKALPKALRTLADDMLALLLISWETRCRGRASRPRPKACRHPNWDRCSWCPAPARATSRDRNSRTDPPPWVGTATRRRRTGLLPSRDRRSWSSRRRSPSPALRRHARRPPPTATDRLCGSWVSVRSCDGTPRPEGAGDENRIEAPNVGVDADSEIHPAPQQVAVVIGAVVGVAESCIRFVVAAARA